MAWAHSSGFKNGDKVHTDRQQRKWGQNFTVFFGVRKGGKQQTWSIVASTGEELRLKESAWASMLKPGWVDRFGKLLDDDAVPATDNDLIAQITAQKSLIDRANVRLLELNKLMTAREVARQAMRKQEVAAVDAAAAVIIKRNAALEDERRTLPPEFQAMF